MGGPNNHLMLYRELLQSKKSCLEISKPSDRALEISKKNLFLTLYPSQRFYVFFLFVCLSDLVNIQGIRGQLFKVNLYLINIHETLTVRND